MSEYSELSSRVDRLEARYEQQNGASQAKMGELSGKLVEVSTVVKEQLASKIWVKELVEPIVQNTTEVRHLVQENIRESRANAQAQEKTNREMAAKHDNLLEERAQRERIEFEERQKREKAESDAKIEALKSQTWDSLLRNKWQPLIVTMVALSTLVGLLANYLIHLK